MRLDRLITLGLVQPVRQALGSVTHHASRITSLPILMYHRITRDTGPALPAYYRTNTSPRVFREHMALLHSAGLKGVTLEKALELILNGGPLREHHVVITFDDGFRNFYTEAFPILAEYAFSATVFLPTAFIQTQRPSLKNTEYMAWDEVRNARSSGIRFGSHTVTHPQLEDLSWKEIESELRDSKRDLEQQLNEPITTFAYPCAFPPPNTEFAKSFTKLLAETGYLCCATTELGRAKCGDDPYRLKRLPMNSLDDPALFRAKVAGSYDWLAMPQRIFKSLKPRRQRGGEAVTQARLDTANAAKTR